MTRTALALESRCSTSQTLLICASSSSYITSWLDIAPGLLAAFGRRQSNVTGRRTPGPQPLVNVPEGYRFVLLFRAIIGRSGSLGPRPGGYWKRANTMVSGPFAVMAQAPLPVQPLLHPAKVLGGVGSAVSVM